MKTPEIKILRKQIDKLESDDFDLGAWKTGAIIILERIFGVGNQKIEQLEKIRYDQSSWTMRQATGSKNMMETCKKQGREILTIAIDELEHLGLPDDVATKKESPLQTAIVGAMEQELKIAQYREIAEIIHSDKTPEDRQKLLIDTLHKYGHDVAEQILVKILLSEPAKAVL